MMRTKEELNKEVSSVFGLKTSLGFDYIDLITPTNIFLVRLGLFNRGTHEQPHWGIGGISNLPSVALANHIHRHWPSHHVDLTEHIGYTWEDLMSL